MGYAPVSLIDIAPTPSDAGTTLSVQPDSGDRYPLPPFVGLVFPVQTIPERGVDSEEITVTSIDGDDFVIVRAGNPIHITAGLQLAALRSIPTYGYGEGVAFSATFPNADAPYRLHLRTPEGGTVTLDGVDAGGGATHVSYEVEEGGVWNSRWESQNASLPESSFFVRFSNVLP